jgi:hypothetical protein
MGCPLDFQMPALLSPHAAEAARCHCCCYPAAAAVLVCHHRLDAPCQPIRESSLRFQTRCVAAAPGTSMYVLGSVEGRVAVEVLDPSPRAQAAKYAFKVTDRIN